MTINRCTGCGKIFSSNKSKLDFFCSIKCKVVYDQKLYDKRDNDWFEVQSEIDLKARREDKNKDFRLSRRRLSNM